MNLRPQNVSAAVAATLTILRAALPWLSQGISSASLRIQTALDLHLQRTWFLFSVHAALCQVLFACHGADCLFALISKRCWLRKSESRAKSGHYPVCFFFQMNAKSSKASFDFSALVDSFFLNINIYILYPCV